MHRLSPAIHKCRWPRINESCS